LGRTLRPVVDSYLHLRFLQPERRGVLMALDAPRARGREQWDAARIEKETAALGCGGSAHTSRLRAARSSTYFVDEGDRVEMAWGEDPVIQGAS
jgi:hypothetical protein